MTYREFSYQEAYAALRGYFLAALPGFKPASPYEVMNAYLESVGSQMRMEVPGKSQTDAGSKGSSLETLLLHSASRNTIYEEIKEFTNWMARQDYLEFNGGGDSGKGTYRATDKLVRTPSLDF